MSYQESLAWLYGLQVFGIKLGLENIQRLIAELSRSDGLQTAVHVNGDLEIAAPWGQRVIHVAGTNGKGSVCAMIDAIARAGGYRTGLFTSPHLVSFRERIRVNGEMIPEGAVATLLTAIRELVASWDPHPTFFEIVTALALQHFARSETDVIILETGMGGRLDATNAVLSTGSIITPIGLDHEKWLGQTLESIAAEKAGIIKPKTPVVSSTQQPEAKEVIRARAAECEAPLLFVSEPYERSPIALSGAHQKHNAALAIAALAAAKIEVDKATIARGLSNVEWPARFQRFDDRVIIDGAHNPAAARVLAATWREMFADQRATLIFAVLSDKDVQGIWEALAPISAHVFLPQIRSERALSPETVGQILSRHTPSLPYSLTPSIDAAIRLARERPDPILVTGSLHFAGEVLACLEGKPAAFEECAQ
ncbi:MAG: dihydrofolate synthase / folylpolyglutamate synthase [Verrucomicrobiota bacterium]|jgi:dihydrofolate synthase/folylpolyglutamate synthase